MGLEELILTTERKRGLIEGEKRGEKRGINQVIMNMLSKNLSDEMISDFAGVSIGYVRKIRVSAANKRTTISN